MADPTDKDPDNDPQSLLGKVGAVRAAALDAIAKAGILGGTLLHTLHAEVPASHGQQQLYTAPPGQEMEAVEHAHHFEIESKGVEPVSGPDPHAPANDNQPPNDRTPAAAAAALPANDNEKPADAVASSATAQREARIANDFAAALPPPPPPPPQEAPAHEQARARR